MKNFKYILSVLTCATMISLTFSSCFTEVKEFLDIQSTTQEVTKPKPLEPSQTGYSYNELKKTVYKELYTLIHDNAKYKIPSVEIKVAETLSEYEIRMVLDAYMYDHPEVFWLDSMYSYSINSDGTTGICLFYTMDWEDLEVAKETFNAKLKEIVSNAPSNATAYELEMYAHDYLVENCDYDNEAVDKEQDNAFSAYGAIVENMAVCSGYSRAFQILCNEFGLECVSISGMSDGENHQWNCVKLDDKWYQVDVTWDDNENGELCQYDYFNLTDEMMLEDHTVWELYSEVEDTYIEGDTYNMYLPKCSDDKYYYYKYSCVTISDIYNSDEMVDAISKSAKNNDKYLSFYIDESLDYTQIYNALLYEGYLYEWVEKANDKNDYEPELDPHCGVYERKDKNIVTLELIYL